MTLVPILRRQYVNTKAKEDSGSIVGKILATLENTEASTKKCLKEFVAKLAKVAKLPIT